MKNIYLILFAASLLFATSCGDAGKKAETGDAETVKTEASGTKYSTIKEGSHLEWRASHLGGLEPRFGKVSLQSATVTVDDNKLATAKIIVDLASLTVENFEADEEKATKLSGHLLSADFFNTEEFPTSSFELTQIQTIEGDFNSNVTGNLTILDVTKSITFSANIKISDTEISINSEDFSVDRSNWGLTYNAEGTEGVPTNYLIADEVGFTINVTLTK